MNKPWYQWLRKRYLTHENIANDAYAHWEKEGRLDGDEVVATLFGPMLRKDTHWLAAELKLDMRADFDYDVFALMNGFKTPEQMGLS